MLGGQAILDQSGRCAANNASASAGLHTGAPGNYGVEAIRALDGKKNDDPFYHLHLQAP